MLKIFTVIGTRPEAIKMAPVIMALKKEKDMHVELIVTGQHRQLLDETLTAFNLSPDYDLNIMGSNQTLSDTTSLVITGLTRIFTQIRPNLVLVHGDTTTTFASTLACFYLQIPVGHVEAGLRTGNIMSPFPEEANRVMTDKLAQLFFAPTNKAVESLLNEGVDRNKIFLTGNTVIDALLFTSAKIKNSFIPSYALFGTATEILKQSSPIILVTAHRRENFGKNFLDICKALKTLSEKYPHWHIVFPAHPNPNVQEPVNLYLRNHTNIHIISTLDYKSMVWLLNRSSIILTDSGGIQEEAPSLRKPVLVMREFTERPEAVASGAAKLVGTNTENLIYEVSDLIDNKSSYSRMVNLDNPYGDGKASERIITAIRSWASS